MGDDKASPAFDRFARSVDKANGAVDRNAVALKKQQAQSDASRGSILGLTGAMANLGGASDIANRKASGLTRALAAVNVATGVAEPALAGLIVTAGGLGAAFASAGAGLGAYGLVIANVAATYKKMEALSKAAASGSPKAVAALEKFVKGLSPAFQAFDKQLELTKQQYRQWATALEGPVLSPLTAGLKLVKPALAALSPLVRAASTALSILVKEIGAKITGGGLERFVAEIRPHVIPAILDFAHAIGNVATGIWGILKAFLPVSGQITGGIVKLTARFKEWAMSLPSHTGFKSLMAVFKNETPLVSSLLKNLVVILKNVAAATVGLASPANSKALLQILTPLSQIMVRLTANQGLVRAVLYFLLLRSSLVQVRGAFLGLKTGMDIFTGAFGVMQKGYGVVGRLVGGFRSAAVAESAFSGTAGTLGGKLSTIASSAGTLIASLSRSVGLWIANTAAMVANRVAMAAVWTWQKLVTAAQWLWNIALDANPIGAVVLALTALVGGLILAYKHFGWFRAAVQAVWTWIKTHWPLLLEILTGPIGLAVVQIVKHWHTITGAVSAAFNWIKTHWPLLLAILTGPIGLLVKFAIDHFQQFKSAAGSALKSVEVFFLHMIDGMLSALRVLTGVLGHLPGRFGEPFRKASAAIDSTKGHIQDLIGKLLEVHSKNIHIIVNADGHYSVPAGGKGSFIHNATGGPIRGPGGPTDDKAGLYALSNNEWVIRANSAARYGDRAMAAVNTGRATIWYPGMASGGAVTGSYTGTPQGTGAFTVGKYNETVKATEDATAKAAAKAMAGAWGAGSGSKLVRYLRQFVGQVPYVWGGTSPSGWDCSGMVQYGLRNALGISAPRTSEQQYAWVKRSGDQAGALAFFVGAGGPPPGHVGVSMGNGQMINAAGTQWGTIVSGTGGNMGFGIPPGHMAKGGKVGKPDPQRKAWLAQLARDVRVLHADEKFAAKRRKVLRRALAIDELWFLTHPHVKKGGIGFNEHEKALRASRHRLSAFNKRESAKETLLGKKIALLRLLTHYPKGLKYGGPGTPAPIDDGSGGGLDGGGGDTGGGTTSAPSGPPPIPPPPMPAWMVAAGLGTGTAPAGFGLVSSMMAPRSFSGTDPIASRSFSGGGRSMEWGGGGQGEGLAALIGAIRAMHADVVGAVGRVAPGTARGFDRSMNSMVAGVAGRFGS